MKKGKEIEYIQVENANLVRMNFRRLSELYTKYAQLVLQIKEIRDEKVKARKKVISDLKKIKQEYEKLCEILPRIKEKKEKEEKHEIVEMEMPVSFEELRKEFEKLREELSKI